MPLKSCVLCVILMGKSRSSVSSGLAYLLYSDTTMSFENLIAGMTYGTSNGFSNQILGQANYINSLQNGGNGAVFTPSVLPYAGFGSAITPHRYHNTMNQLHALGRPARPVAGALRHLLQPQNLQMHEMQQLMGLMKQFFQAFPQLFAGLSPQSQSFVRDVIQQAPGLCGCK